MKLKVNLEYFFTDHRKNIIVDVDEKNYNIVKHVIDLIMYMYFLPYNKDQELAMFIEECFVHPSLPISILFQSDTPVRLQAVRKLDNDKNLEIKDHKETNVCPNCKFQESPASNSSLKRKRKSPDDIENVQSAFGKKIQKYSNIINQELGQNDCYTKIKSSNLMLKDTVFSDEIFKGTNFKSKTLEYKKINNSPESIIFHDISNSDYKLKYLAIILKKQNTGSICSNDQSEIYSSNEKSTSTLKNDDLYRNKESSNKSKLNKFDRSTKSDSSVNEPYCNKESEPEYSIAEQSTMLIEQAESSDMNREILISSTPISNYQVICKSSSSDNTLKDDELNIRRKRKRKHNKRKKAERRKLLAISNQENCIAQMGLESKNDLPYEVKCFSSQNIHSLNETDKNEIATPIAIKTNSKLSSVVLNGNDTKKIIAKANDFEQCNQINQPIIPEDFPSLSFNDNINHIEFSELISLSNKDESTIYSEYRLKREQQNKIAQENVSFVKDNQKPLKKVCMDPPDLKIEYSNSDLHSNDFGFISSMEHFTDPMVCAINFSNKNICLNAANKVTMHLNLKGIRSSNFNRQTLGYNAKNIQSNSNQKVTKNDLKSLDLIKEDLHIINSPIHDLPAKDNSNTFEESKPILVSKKRKEKSKPRVFGSLGIFLSKLKQNGHPEKISETNVCIKGSKTSNTTNDEKLTNSEETGVNSSSASYQKILTQHSNGVENADTNVVLIDDEDENSEHTSKIDFERCSILSSLPKLGDIIAYKILELDHKLCPIYSEYKVAKVQKIYEMTVHLLDRVNKSINIFDWRDVHSPRLIFP